MTPEEEQLLIRAARYQLWAAFGKMIAVALGILWVATNCHGQVTESFLDRISWLESRNNDAARGRHGEVGRFQLRQIALDELNRTDGTSYLVHQMVDPKLARKACRRYLEILARQLHTTDQRILRMAYVCGPSRAARRIRSSATLSAARKGLAAHCARQRFMVGVFTAAKTPAMAGPSALSRRQS